MRVGNCTLNEIQKQCAQGCDNCPRNLAKVCEQTDYVLFSLKGLDQEIEIETEKSDKDIAFDLINEKRVDIKMVHWAYPSVEAYNVWVREHKNSFPRKELTKDEFEFIGRLAGAK